MSDQGTTGVMIKSFHLAINYLRIYPPTSQMVTAAFDAFFKALCPLLEKSGSLTLSDLSGKLLVDGKETDHREAQAAAGNILKLFAPQEIQSITFSAGITRDELTEFVAALLRKRREELPGFPHVTLDQTVYVAMVKGEEAVIKITEMINGSGGEIVGIITSLRESYDLIDRLPDQAGKVTAQRRLAEELARQNPAVLREIFERELPPRIEESGLKVQLLQALSQEKIHAIFGQIAGWYEEIRKKEGSDFAAVEQLEKLQKFIQTVLGAPAAKEIPRQFFEQLLQRGLIDHLPEWFTPEAAKPTTVFAVEQLLEKDPADLLEDNVRDGLPPMVEKLCQIENTDLLFKLLGKLLENLSNSSAKIRYLALQALAAVHDVLQARAREPLLRSLELPLLNGARRESSADVHALMAGILRQRARQNLLHGEYDLALRIIELFEQHSSGEIMPNEKIREDARAARAGVIADVMEILVADLKSDDEARRLGSYQILSRAGDSSTEPLIRVIKESDDLRSRRLAAQALKSLGESARKRFREELNFGLTAEEMVHVIEALHDLGGQEAVAELQSLIRYPATPVKREILRYLAKINTRQSAALIIEELKDSDASVVSEAVRLLGELKCAEAAETLVALLRASATPASLQEEICIALGNIGAPAAIPALIARLRRNTAWFSRAGTDNDKVRVRAAWSLRKFAGPDIEEALERAGRDRVAPVALTAKESLAVLRQKGMGR